MGLSIDLGCHNTQHVGRDFGELPSGASERKEQSLMVSLEGRELVMVPQQQQPLDDIPSLSETPSPPTTLTSSPATERKSQAQQQGFSYQPTPFGGFAPAWPELNAQPSKNTSLFQFSNTTLGQLEGFTSSNTFGNSDSLFGFTNDTFGSPPPIGSAYALEPSASSASSSRSNSPPFRSYGDGYYSTNRPRKPLHKDFFPNNTSSERVWLKKKVEIFRLFADVDDCSAEQRKGKMAATATASEPDSVSLGCCWLKFKECKGDKKQVMFGWSITTGKEVLNESVNEDTMVEWKDTDVFVTFQNDKKYRLRVCNQKSFTAETISGCIQDMKQRLKLRRKDLFVLNRSHSSHAERREREQHHAEALRGLSVSIRGRDDSQAVNDLPSLTDSEETTPSPTTCTSMNVSDDEHFPLTAGGDDENSRPVNDHFPLAVGGFVDNHISFTF
ncbi:hypothetical protein HK102_002079 [Quaeritorhiza haematococci]|nr:hypothetical protein HK102_002079 [Quaeritorhiza haematococci]